MRPYSSYNLLNHGEKYAFELALKLSEGSLASSLATYSQIGEISIEISINFAIELSGLLLAFSRIAFTL
jgi:hypothetical protein